MRIVPSYLVALAGHQHARQQLELVHVLRAAVDVREGREEERIRGDRTVLFLGARGLELQPDDLLGGQLYHDEVDARGQPQSLVVDVALCVHGEPAPLF